MDTTVVIIFMIIIVISGNYFIIKYGMNKIREDAEHKGLTVKKLIGNPFTLASEEGGRYITVLNISMSLVTCKKLLAKQAC